jgi:hypothetical protein
MFATSLFSRRESFFSSSSDKMMKPYAEYHGVYGGGADERVDQRGGQAAPPYALEVR